MYVYFFGYQNDGVLYSMKVDHKRDCPNDPRLIDIFVKPEDCTVPYKQDLPSYIAMRRYSVPKTEGKVYRRCFWLKEHDRVKASEIIHKYTKETEAKKEKPTHAQEVKMLNDKILALQLQINQLKADIFMMKLDKEVKK